MSVEPQPAVTAIAPWFGSNRSCAHRVGELLAGCKWVGVPFAGGMCELLHITAPTVVVGDLHAHVLNLAAVVASPDLNTRLRERLDGLPFHPDILEAAQDRCRTRENTVADWFGTEKAAPPCDLDWATDYFVCAWMARNGLAGTHAEFGAGMSIRWKSGGGDSATRFRNATESLAAWLVVMRRCTFVRHDVFRFLADVYDLAGHGLYLDPPFPDAGDGYKHAFDENDQRQLAGKLAMFQACKVVVRFYDHPLIRRLYPESAWEWHRPEGGKTQHNEAAPEVLLVNRRAS